MKRDAKRNALKEAPTTRDVLVAVSKLADHMESRFDGLENRMGNVEKKVDGLEKKMDGLEKKMVTKAYLDEKIGDLRGDITQLVHKEDRKFTALVHLLEDKDVLSEEDAVRILRMPPFELGRSL